MPRVSRSRLTGSGSDEEDPFLPQKRRFARELQQRCVKMGWTQSDLSRKSGLSGDSISKYFNAKQVPSPTNLGKLARAFKCPPEELFPEPSISETGELNVLEIKQVLGNPDKVVLRVNKVVTFDAASKIMELLRDQ